MIDKGKLIKIKSFRESGFAKLFPDQGRQAIKEAFTSSNDNFNVQNDVTYVEDTHDVDVLNRHDVETIEVTQKSDKRTPQRPLRRSLSMQHREQNKVKYLTLRFISNSIIVLMSWW